MTLAEATALGVLQGVTEFLPISSDGHLALAEALLPQGPARPLLFNVIVHLGTLLAIAIVLRARIASLIAAAFAPGEGAANPEVQRARRWILLIVVASIPTAIVGLLLRDLVETLTTRPPWVGGGLLGTAALLVFAQRSSGGKRDADALGIADAAYIGLAQGLAVLPGLSRSGSTIAVALARDVRPDVSVEFSVLISMPAVLGANLLELSSADASVLASESAALAVAFVAAAATGVLALRALRWVVVRNRLLPFAVYCVLLGAGAIALG